MRSLSLVCLPALAILCFFSTSARATRCGENIVSVGQSSFEIRQLCGSPVHVDRVFQTHHSRQMASVRESGTPLTLEPIERWTYVLSKNEFVVSMEFEHGVLVSIQQEGRPPAGTGSIENCRRSLHSNGDTAAEVLLRCGRPADSIRWVYERDVTDMKGFSGQRVSVIHDRWTYNFGPQEFLRTLGFENGRLVDQRTGGYGF